ncbi:Transcriptional repressor PaaX [Aliiroseovarius pelagivivens]|uniref:Transcriptional repressor PaaX n=1 Tax=Aliiroseovarius pelagivivens TaxID=1639690 RepID=A0A2R8ALC9_9RHOB|nr:PaaX family transcriptional regulator [Aliiroseovarius pelagivivens]SPF76810.1 Transcriptional repressor PaaX [Aliiroseovarius pelagivivens]
MTLTDPLQETLAHLRDSSDLRVWSVIVTLMGDLTVMGAPDADASGVSGQALGKVMAALGIRPEATRVALHRLRKDGWIESTRHGRRSVYHLTQDGLAQTKAVADRIYGPARAAPAQWHLLALPPHAEDDGSFDSLIAEGFSELMPGVFLGTSAPRTTPEALHFSDPKAELPSWVIAKLAPPKLQIDSDQLRKTIKHLPLGALHSLSALDRAALRLVLLHEWRRIALRLPDLPVEAICPDLQVRALVHEALKALGPLPVDQLSP